MVFKRRLPGILLAAGVVLIGLQLVIPMGFGPSLDDVTAAGQPRAELSLSSFRANQSVIITIEVPNSEQWARIRSNWGDPGYIVYAQTDRRWLIPFESLNMTVGVKAGERVMAVRSAEHAPYAISSDALDYGAAFTASPGDRLQVALTSKSDALPTGVVVVEPYWGITMKDHIVSAMVEDNTRRWLVGAAAIGLALVVGGALMLRTRSD